jgi:hypothetical protein
MMPATLSGSGAGAAKRSSSGGHQPLARLRIGDEEGQQRGQRHEETPGPPPAREQQQRPQHEQAREHVGRIDDEPENLADHRRHEPLPDACRRGD